MIGFIKLSSFHSYVDSIDKHKLQGENPCQVLLVLPGLMSVLTSYEAALVSIKESLIYHEITLANACRGL